MTSLLQLDTRVRPPHVAGRDMPDPLEDGLDPNFLSSYVSSFTLPLPAHLLKATDFTALSRIRQVPTIGGTQVLSETPQDDLPFTKKFPVGLEFINRVDQLPLCRYIAQTYTDLGIEMVTRHVVVAHAPKSVRLHRDNGVHCILVTPLRNAEHSRVWFAKPDCKIVGTFIMEPDRAYLLNVSQLHAMVVDHGTGGVWFTRVAFTNITYTEVRDHLTEVMGAPYMTYGH